MLSYAKCLALAFAIRSTNTGAAPELLSVSGVSYPRRSEPMGVGIVSGSRDASRKSGTRGKPGSRGKVWNPDPCSFGSDW